MTDRLRAYAAALRERGINDRQETDRGARMASGIGSSGVPWTEPARLVKY